MDIFMGLKDNPNRKNHGCSSNKCGFSGFPVNSPRENQSTEDFHGNPIERSRPGATPGGGIPTRPFQLEAGEVSVAAMVNEDKWGFP